MNSRPAGASLFHGCRYGGQPATSSDTQRLELPVSEPTCRFFTDTLAEDMPRRGKDQLTPRVDDSRDEEARVGVNGGSMVMNLASCPRLPKNDRSE